MIRQTDYTRRRLAQTSERLLALVYPETRPVDELLVSEETGRIGWAEAQRLEYRPAKLGERFGPLWATFWFRLRAAVPEKWRGRRVDLLWFSNSEATLWRDGRVVQGMNVHHRDAVLAEKAQPGELSAEVELACNGLFGKQRSAVELTQCELALFDPDVCKLYFDFETLRALEAEEDLDPSLAGELRAARRAG